jgi:hypothetical protein
VALNARPGVDVFNAGAGYTGLLFSERARDQITANPGGGQADATLTRMVSPVTTVATVGDNVKLPPRSPDATR